MLDGQHRARVPPQIHLCIAAYEQIYDEAFIHEVGTLCVAIDVLDGFSHLVRHLI